MITVVLVDDHRVVREGVRTLLTAESDIEVIGEEGDGARALELIERLQPAVAVLDLMLPGLGGLDIAREVRRRTPGSAVVVLSMFGTSAYVREALAAGVRGYVLKDASGAELLHAVREAAAGRRYVSPALDTAVAEADRRAPPLDPFDTLTGRERQVLRLAADGFTSAQVAARLGISPRTAEAHRANLMRKLGLHSQTDLVRYGLQRGLTADPTAGGESR